MKKQIIGVIAIPMGFMMLALGCKTKPQTPDIAPATTPAHTFTQNGSVKEIVIWPENPEFPEIEGKAAFVSYCGICHSLRYITSQPAFPRKTWEAEVHKMVDKYGAPIDSATSLKIVDYLMKINGTTE